MGTGRVLISRGLWIFNYSQPSFLLKYNKRQKRLINNMKNLIQKEKEILGSIRFWQVLVGAVLVVLVDTSVIAETYVPVVDAILAVLGISVGIRTIDKLGKNVGNK